MVTFFVIYRGGSVEEARPLAVCTSPKVIRQVAELLIEDIPASEADPVTLAKRAGLSEALSELCRECAQ